MSSRVSSCIEIQIFQTATLDEKTTKMKVIDLEKLHNFIVDNFFIKIIYLKKIMFEFLTFKIRTF